MYFPNIIEENCYDADHVDHVISEIKSNLPDYFEKYIESEGGHSLDQPNFEQLAKAFGTTLNNKKKRKIDPKKILNRMIKEGIDNFEKDRDAYLKILEEEALLEYTDNPAPFKETVLRNKCPIIRKTLQNKKAKELDRYREKFNFADAGDLHRTVLNIVKFANHYAKKNYDNKDFELRNTIETMGYSELSNNDDYVIYGVIGGGIKSHFLYKLYPNIFPYRSQEALWALWYLTSKKSFQCNEDSEFLMINVEKTTTQQNYFYPYDLFALYALQIFIFLKKQALKYDIKVDIRYRFTLVNDFLQFVANCHEDEIMLLKNQAKEYMYDH